jgi:hypothetical protein
LLERELLDVDSTQARLGYLDWAICGRALAAPHGLCFAIAGGFRYSNRQWM